MLEPDDHLRKPRNPNSQGGVPLRAGEVSPPVPQQTLWQRLFEQKSRRSARQGRQRSRAVDRSGSRLPPGGLSQVSSAQANLNRPESAKQSGSQRQGQQRESRRGSIDIADQHDSLSSHGKSVTASRVRQEISAPTQTSRRGKGATEGLPWLSAGRRSLESRGAVNPRSPRRPADSVVEQGQSRGSLAELSGRSNLSRRRTVKPRSLGMTVTLYATRMLILSVGLGVLAGTVLSVWDPASRSLVGSQPPVKQAGVSGTNPGQGGAIAASQQVTRGQELSPLKLAIQTLSQKTPQMVPGLFLLDLDTNDFVDISGTATHSAASTIKVPVLVAFLQDVDAGKIRLDEPLVMQKELMASGSGNMQLQPAGTRFTALETVTKMIIASDNTATNMVIARLGGLRALNQRFRAWGMVNTSLNSVLPDLGGTNTTSPKEMAILLARVSQGELLSMRSRDRMFDIMRRTENNSQLPQGLGAGATIAHKTGDIGNLIGDVGLIDLPNGKRYAIAVLVKRPFNEDQAYEVVAQISRVVYQFFNRPASGQAITAPLPTTSPSPNDSQPEPEPAPEPGNTQPENPQDHGDTSASL